MRHGLSVTPRCRRLAFKSSAQHAGPMPELASKFLQAFIPLFVAIDPIGLAAIFLAMSVGVPKTVRKKIANQAAWTGGGVALLFLLLGQTIFKALGITANDFQIAGGLILFIIA